MASQRIIVASFVGAAATAVAKLFESWRALDPNHDKPAVDRFCERWRMNDTSVHLAYYCAWVDRWLMGDIVPGPGTVGGNRFQATCMTKGVAEKHAAQCGTQWSEQEWLAARLREGAGSMAKLTNDISIVVVREVFGSSLADEETIDAMKTIPPWIADNHAATEDIV